jgi:hypothetical protein
MKKAILTFGLFSMMMALTSFTTPQFSTVPKIAFETGGKGGQQVPPAKTLDFEAPNNKLLIVDSKVLYCNYRSGQQMPEMNEL